MAQRGLPEEKQLNDKLPSEMLVNEIWPSNCQDFSFLKRASLVCKFWQGSAEELARERFKYYFPDLYTWDMDKTDAELGIPLSWCRRLELALLQYCCEFTPQELADYRAFRAGDLDAIKKIFSAENAVDRLLLRDNQQRTGFFYLAKNHTLKHRQAVFDGIFSALSEPYIKNKNVENNGQWKEVLFDKDLEIDWVNLVENFDRKDFIPEVLLFAVVCNQTSEIKKFIETIKKQNKLNVCLVGLLCLAMRYDQIDAFLLMLEYEPVALFVINDFLAGRNISQHFADRLFQHVLTLDLSEDGARRHLLHWAQIFNQPHYFSSVQMLPQQRTAVLNDTIIIFPNSWRIFSNKRIEADAYHPIKFACLWGIDLYRLAVSAGAMYRSAHDLLKTAARYGDADLLQLFLSLADLQGDTNKALDLAIKRGYLDCVRVLLKHDVKINAGHVITAFESRQIHILDFFYQDEERRKLVKLELAVACKGQYGVAPLIRWFQEECHLSLLKMLLKFGLDVNAGGVQNKSPLHFLAEDVREDHSELMQQLKGAMVDKLDNMKCTPLHCAANVLDDALNKVTLRHIVVLLELGADPNLKNEKELSVFDVLRGRLKVGVFVEVELIISSLRKAVIARSAVCDEAIQLRL